MNSKSKGMLSHGLKVITITIFTLALLGVFLSPFVFMVFTSLKTQAQISIIKAEHFEANEDATQRGVCTAPTFDSGPVGVLTTASDPALANLVLPLRLK